MKSPAVKLVAILLVFFACPRVKAVGGEDHFFPGNENIRLQDGDILLSYTPGILNSCNRVFARPEGRYAHALLYVVLPDSGGRLVDFSADGFVLAGTDNLKKLRAAALVRSRVSPEKEKLAEVLAKMKKLYDEGRLKFDISARRTDEDCKGYYCTEFISRVFLLAGLPDPFPARTLSGDDFWTSWCREHLDMDYTRVVSPNAVLFLPDFELVAEYQNKDREAERREEILDAIMTRIRVYLREEGMDVRSPSLGSRLLAGLAGIGLCGDPLAKGLPAKSRAVFFVLKEFVFITARRVERAVSLRGEEGWSEEDILSLTRRTADAFRDRYFIRRGH